MGHLFQARYRPHGASSLVVQLMQQDECFGRMTIEAAEALKDSLAAAIKTVKVDQSQQGQPRPGPQNRHHSPLGPPAQPGLPTLESQPRLVTVEELAEAVRVPVQGIYDLLKKVPDGIVVRLGRRMRVKETAFIEWMNAGAPLRK